MAGGDPTELIRELLRISRELESYEGDCDAPASVAFLRGRRDLLLQALRSHMRRFENVEGTDAKVSLPPATTRRDSGVRTRSGSWANPTPARSRRKVRP
ncbi:hypothetical protein BH09MYX1_BH09MYX1_67080 [soil metagenome]